MRFSHRLAFQYPPPHRLDKMDRSPAVASTGRPKSTSVETSYRIPTIAVEQPDGTGEPLVQDFNDGFPPNAFELRAGGSGAIEPPYEPSFSPDEDSDAAPPPPDFTRRGIHIPTRNSSRQGRHRIRDPKSISSGATASSVPTSPRSRKLSSADFIQSYETSASSIQNLPPLQIKGIQDDSDQLEPLMEDDPQSFDLVAPADEATNNTYSLEKRSEQLMSKEHLALLFADPKLLLKFTSFLSEYRPQSVPILVYYLDALKALRAIKYANAVAEALEPIDGHEFTEHPARATANSILEDKADQAFQAMVRDDLPAYVSYTWTQVVSISIQRRITGTLPPHLREASEGLAEVFCLTDPSRSDNPIVFASEEFHRTTQYGMSYSIGRNCRFLQSPKTNPNSVRRLAETVVAGKELVEVFINYRRDGSPFMNLLMIAPLLDSRGTIRYFIGAQVDVSGLLKDCTDLEALQRLVANNGADLDSQEETRDNFQELSEMFNASELDTVRRFGGRMHREQIEENEHDSGMQHRPRLLLKDPSPGLAAKTFNFGEARVSGKLEGVYQNYLLVRPYPSLRILFTSPSLRVPGTLQSPFMNRIGGSSRVRDELTAALAEGRGVTAKVRWVSRADDEGRSRWIHCTPLIGHNGSVGVWMVVVVDEENSSNVRRFRQAPPVAQVIGGKEYDPNSPRGQGYSNDVGRMRGKPAHVAVMEKHSSEARAAARKGSSSSPAPTHSSEFSFNIS
ncbi:hypothetical protein BJ546DRAFT_1060797 [Cryomyces antarcticus]